MEMTDTGGQDKQEKGSANRKRCSDHHGPERRPSAPRGIGTPNKNVHERHGSSSHGEAFEDFEEFVLDFDDYDLLESIHTHMETPAEPMRKFCTGPSLYFCLRSVSCCQKVNVTANFQWRKGHMTSLIFYFYSGDQ